jgi:hypothetical protein
MYFAWGHFSIGKKYGAPDEPSGMQQPSDFDRATSAAPDVTSLIPASIALMKNLLPAANCARRGLTSRGYSTCETTCRLPRC